MPFNFNWVIEGELAGMGRPGSAMELTGEMSPVERRFLGWMAGSRDLRMERKALALRIGVEETDDFEIDRRLIQVYKKFRDVWGILESYREGMGQNGEALDSFRLNPEKLRTDLLFLKDQGIGSVVTLSEKPLDPEVLAEFDFDVAHIPLVDGRAPEQDLIDVFVGYVHRTLNAGMAVVVHCLGGYGRTGTTLACYLLHRGRTAEEAIQEVRSKRPGSIEAGDQEDAVQVYEGRKLGVETSAPDSGSPTLGS